MAKQGRFGKNYTSPYSQPTQQYPSQSEEFISLYPSNHNTTKQRKDCAQQNGEYGKIPNYDEQRRRWSSPCKGNINHHFRKANPERGNEANASYFHFSMLEDPWSQLMERKHAIDKSEINISQFLAKIAFFQIDRQCIVQIKVESRKKNIIKNFRIGIQMVNREELFGLLREQDRTRVTVSKLEIPDVVKDTKGH
uniref:Uncharacterized protein n=1 Tax=Glossina brevipalpis TaxID=37001 RepID=A0A1A9X2T5_9MUSC